MEKVYCESTEKTMFRASCELRRRKKDDQGRPIIPECNGCMGPKSLSEMEDKLMDDQTKTDELPMCSKCGEKRCPKNLKSRKWSGGVGLCWGCYRIVGKEEKGEAPPATKKRKSADPPAAPPVAKPPEPASPDVTQPGPASYSIVDPDSEDHPTAYKMPTAAPVLLKTFKDPEAARDFVTALEDAGVEVIVEILVSAVPEEGRGH